jgi:hypothetical protein
MSTDAWTVWLVIAGVWIVVAWSDRGGDKAAIAWLRNTFIR